MTSIIIPCRNEEECISWCLDSIVENDYPKKNLEVLVVDGMSDDQTRSILHFYVKRYSYIRILDNPKIEQPIGLNIGIKSSKGDIVIRMDAHSKYKSNYISECVNALLSYGADNVGGRWVTTPRENTLIGRSICFATSVSFGVGNAYYRLNKVYSNGPSLHKIRWDINVPYFCCRREVFDKIGLFNENLNRSEDIDFRSRLKEAGFRTLFVPSIVCYYLMRTKLSKFISHMFRNGKWVLLPLIYVPTISFSGRHLVPFLFICGIIWTSAFAYFTIFPFFVLVVIYVITNFFYTIGIAFRERDFRFFFTMPWIFLFLHFSYGIGSIFGLTYLLKNRIKSKLRTILAL